MSALLDLAIVVPTFNERANVATLVAKLDQALGDRRWEVIFVDDDSPDGTAEEARTLGRVDARVAVVAFVPPYSLSTELARGLLPDSVPHSDAAADAGRTALLVAALGGAPEHLLTATRDYLHQNYRLVPFDPEKLDAAEALRERELLRALGVAGFSAANRAVSV